MKYKLGDIADITVGLNFQSKSFNQTGDGYRLIRGKNIGKGSLHWGKDSMFWANIRNIPKKYVMSCGDIVLSMDGNVVQNKSRVSSQDLPAFLVQRVARLRAKDGFSQDYIWYIVNTHEYESYISGTKTGTTIQHISQKQIADFNVNIPDLETQQKVVRILSALDEKIELNNKENDLLVEILKTNYKKFINSFEGKIKIPLQDIFNFQEGPGIRNWQYVEKDGTKFINIRCIKEDDIDLSTANMISDKEANGKYAHFMLNENDIVVSTSGTLGRSQIIRKCHLPLCLNTSVIRFWPKEPHYYSFMYCYLISNEFLHNLDTMATGSAQRNFGPMHLKQIYIYMPEGSSIDKFENANHPIIDKLCANRDNTLLLTKIRNTLLPKLMNGEIELNGVFAND